MEADHDEDLLAEVLAILDAELEPSATTSGSEVHDLSLASVIPPHDPSIGALDETTEVVADPIHQRDRFVKLAPAIAPAGNVVLQGGDKTKHDSVVAAAKPSGKRVRKYDPNKARNERVREIHSLRNEVSELTRQVAALQASGVHKDETLAVCGVTSLPANLLMWEDICRHQLLRRIRSENDNALLKRAVDEQVKIVNSMQRLLRRPSKVLDLDVLQLPTTKRMYSLPTDSEADVKNFDKLLADVEETYLESDHIVELNGHACGSKPSHCSQLRDGEDGRYVDLSSSMYLPFDLTDTANAAWEFYSGPKKHRGPLYYKTAKTLEASETIVEKFALEWFAKGTRADFRHWQVLRQYVDEGCIKVIWASIVEPVEFANKPFSSCAFREKGFVIATRPAVHEALGSPDCTHLVRIRRLVPYITRSPETALSSTDKREIGAMIDYVLTVENAASHLECIEDALTRQRQKANGVTR